MLLIFIASEDAESGDRGSRILAPIVRWFVPDISAFALERTVLLARKAVHFVTFGLLAALVFRALARPPAILPLAAATAWKAWGITAAYAVLDEVHQTFVPSRMGSAVDVLIDALGAGFAVVLLRIVCRRRRSSPSVVRDEVHDPREPLEGPGKLAK
ncbi:MAG: VanZ family protein [Limisphaerales bacterium]